MFTKKPLTRTNIRVKVDLERGNENEKNNHKIQWSNFTLLGPYHWCICYERSMQILK